MLALGMGYSDCVGGGGPGACGRREAAYSQLPADGLSTGSSGIGSMSGECVCGGGATRRRNHKPVVIEDVEIPVWLGGKQKWLTGLTKRTTCDDVVYALLSSHGRGVDVTQYAVHERWRGVERPLSGRTKILKVWRTWGVDARNVRLSLRRVENHLDTSSEASHTLRRRRRQHSSRRNSPGGRKKSARSSDKKRKEERASNWMDEMTENKASIYQNRRESRRTEEHRAKRNSCEDTWPDRKSSDDDYKLVKRQSDRILERRAHDEHAVKEKRNSRDDAQSKRDSYEDKSDGRKNSGNNQKDIFGRTITESSRTSCWKPLKSKDLSSSFYGASSGNNHDETKTKFTSCLGSQSYSIYHKQKLERAAPSGIARHDSEPMGSSRQDRDAEVSRDNRFSRQQSEPLRRSKRTREDGERSNDEKRRQAERESSDSDALKKASPEIVSDDRRKGLASQPPPPPPKRGPADPYGAKAFHDLVKVILDQERAMQEQNAAIKAAEAEIAVIEAGVQNRVTEAEQNESLFPKLRSSDPETYLHLLTSILGLQEKLESEEVRVAALTEELRQLHPGAGTHEVEEAEELRHEIHRCRRLSAAQQQQLDLVTATLTAAETTLARKQAMMAVLTDQLSRQGEQEKEEEVITAETQLTEQDEQGDDTCRTHSETLVSGGSSRPQGSRDRDQRDCGHDSQEGSFQQQHAQYGRRGTAEKHSIRSTIEKFNTRYTAEKSSSENRRTNKEDLTFNSGHCVKNLKNIGVRSSYKDSSASSLDNGNRNDLTSASNPSSGHGSSDHERVPPPRVSYHPKVGGGFFDSCPLQPDEEDKVDSPRGRTNESSSSTYVYSPMSSTHENRSHSSSAATDSGHGSSGDASGCDSFLQTSVSSTDSGMSNGSADSDGKETGSNSRSSDRYNNSQSVNSDRVNSEGVNVTGDSDTGVYQSKLVIKLSDQDVSHQQAESQNSSREPSNGDNFTEDDPALEDQNFGAQKDDDLTSRDVFSEVVVANLDEDDEDDDDTEYEYDTIEVISDDSDKPRGILKSHSDSGKGRTSGECVNFDPKLTQVWEYWKYDSHDYVNWDDLVDHGYADEEGMDDYVHYQGYYANEPHQYANESLAYANNTNNYANEHGQYANEHFQYANAKDYTTSDSTWLQSIYDNQSGLSQGFAHNVDSGELEADVMVPYRTYHTVPSPGGDTVSKLSCSDDSNSDTGLSSMTSEDAAGSGGLETLV